MEMHLKEQKSNLIIGRKKDKREEVQEETLSKWIKSGYSGYSIISMGVGKSRIITNAINHIMETPLKDELLKCEIPILIVVSSTQLRDKEMPAELEKWGCKHEVKLACYQSTYRWKKEIGLLIADEMDFALGAGAKYMKTFINNKFKYFFGLSGTILGKKAELSNLLFNKLPFFKYPIKQAQVDGVLNKTVFWIHEVPLSYKKSETAPYGEISKYKWIEKKIKECKENYESYLDCVRKTHDEGCYEEMMKWKRYKEYWESSGKNKNSRLEFLRTADSLVEYAKRLIWRVLEKSEKNKVLLFSEYTKTIDKITPYGYYGNKKDNAEILKSFNEGKIRVLGAAKKVYRGINFNGLNHCIVQSYSSSITNAHQGFVGRMVRLDPGDTAYVHILVSYYTDNEGNKIYTQNMAWAKKFLNTREFSHIKKFIYNEGLR